MFYHGKMVIAAVRGSPATAPSRTGKFQIRNRAPTPGPYDTTGSSSEGLRTEYGSGSETYGDISMLQDVSDVPIPDESDSSTEMAFTNKTFKKTAPEDTSSGRQWGLPQDSSVDGAEAVERNSLDVTLSEIRDQSPGRKFRRRGSTVKSAKTKRVQRRGVPMREEFFSKIGWTRSFISGPADPIHNPHMVWCHMCKKNFSFRTKGTVEILRHHRTEKHLRRDQKWRYEHLISVDPVTGKVQHRVRGRNGKILSKIELAQELPKFIHTELIDVGFPFYDDYIKGSTSALATPQSRMKTQICLIGDFIQSLGDLRILRKLWARAGSYTGYQTAFQDFDWSEEHIMVSSPVHPSIRLWVKIRGFDWAKLHLYRGLFAFQAIFQHVFNCMMNDIAEQVTASQHFGVEFERRGTNRLITLHFWKGAKLCRVFICRSGLSSTGLAEELGSLSRLLSVISTAPDIVAISGCPVDLIQTVDRHPSYPRGVQSCFRFESLNLQTLMHKANYSVFGHIDMFSVLQCLLFSLGGSLSEDWNIESAELVRVSLFLLNLIGESLVGGSRGC